MATMRLGVIVGLGREPEAAIGKVQALELPTCQLSAWEMELLTPEMARRARQAADAAGVEITSLWAGWPGPKVWNLTEGPLTLGLVPATYRAVRIEALKRGADFAVSLGVPSITTHVGFIPENPNDPTYRELLIALWEVAGYCRARGLQFWFETGQETPVTLLRTIQDLEQMGLDNLGINLDPANLILYGKANPVDALDVFGRYVRGVHVKDGVYPTDGRRLGHEVPVGEGKVNFPVFIAKLKALGYQGALTIEREISGERQVADIRRAVALLTPLLAEPAAS